jgi:hydroxymethylpyrimidine pyrophosphatase-like HAD family hydrolase
MWTGAAVDPESLTSLRNALASLESIPMEDRRRTLLLEGRSVPVDLGYEIGELEKDIHYLAHGEDALMAMLAEIHSDFEAQVERAMEIVAGRVYRVFVTDRDGTVNNYCARYRTSVQSAYNALLLARFAKRKTHTSVVLTSAPLAEPGILDISVAPDGAMVYAASKGRECVDLRGIRHHLPFDSDQRRALDELNGRLSDLVKQPVYQKFALIGSGLQFKFGQTTVARQDIAKSVDDEESYAMLRMVQRLVREVDPEGERLVIEDTGLDIEIMLTVDDAEGGLKDFDKGDGVAAVASQLGLDLSQGPQLVCGDTNSDVPMLVKVAEQCPDVRAVFVTRDKALAAKVAKVRAKSVVVEEPDVLVAALGRSAGVGDG